MIKTFYSLDGTCQLELEFEKVDLINSKDIVSLIKDFTNGNVVVATRDKSVFATKAQEGREIDNRMRYQIGGRSYVLKNELKKVNKRDVELDSMLACFNNGFTLIIKGEKFKESFKQTDEVWEMYAPIDENKKYIKINKNIYFMTLWGEIVIAPKGSFLCIENLKMREFYIVPNSYFKQAYTIKEELGKIDNLSK